MIIRPSRFALLAALPLLATAACGDREPERTGTEAASPASDEASRLRQSIESATYTPPAADEDSQSGSNGASDSDSEDSASADRGGAVEGELEDAEAEPAMVRAQILLDRTRFSPGIIDGLGGENTRQAIAAFQEANDLEVTGELNAEVFDRLTSTTWPGCCPARA